MQQDLGLSLGFSVLKGQPVPFDLQMALLGGTTAAGWNAGAELTFLAHGPHWPARYKEVHGTLLGLEPRVTARFAWRDACASVGLANVATIVVGKETMLAIVALAEYKFLGAAPLEAGQARLFRVDDRMLGLGLRLIR